LANAQAAGNTPHSPRKYFREDMICDLRKRANAAIAAALPRRRF
jgi:hypothetical protein